METYANQASLAVGVTGEVDSTALVVLLNSKGVAASGGRLNGSPDGSGGGNWGRSRDGGSGPRDGRSSNGAGGGSGANGSDQSSGSPGGGREGSGLSGRGATECCNAGARDNVGIGILGVKVEENTNTVALVAADKVEVLAGPSIAAGSDSDLGAGGIELSAASRVHWETVSRFLQEKKFTTTHP